MPRYIVERTFPDGLEIPIATAALRSAGPSYNETASWASRGSIPT